jgi:hypothetical protein
VLDADSIHEFNLELGQVVEPFVGTDVTSRLTFRHSSRFRVIPLPDNSIADNEGRHLGEFGKPLPDSFDAVKAVSANFAKRVFRWRDTSESRGGKC